jgi:hypothetical protein
MLSLPRTQRPTGTFSINRDSAQAQGLVGWYPFQPSILNGYVGSSLPFVPVTSGDVLQVGLSIGGLGPSFGNAGANHGIDRNIGLSNVAPFSVACWFYPTNLGGQQGLYRSQGSGFNGWYLYDQANVPSFQAFDGSAGTATATTNNVNFAWQHMVGVEYATNLRACFRNGAGKGTNSSTIVPGATLAEEIGAIGGASAYVGSIADIRVYNRALSDADVWALYDPRTRWDLYWQPNTRAYSFMSAIAAGTAGYLLVKN